jgi:hypothetical protein
MTPDKGEGEEKSHQKNYFRTMGASNLNQQSCSRMNESAMTLTFVSRVSHTPFRIVPGNAMD